MGIALALTAATAGCASKAEHMDTDVKDGDIFASGKVVQVQEGESAFLSTVDPNSEFGKKYVRDIPMQDHVYPRGPKDEEAPVVVEEPSRFNVQVTLQGESSKLANDAACETFRVEGNPKYIGALAIGGQENAVFISRPSDNEGFVYVCSFQDIEPSKDDGIVIFGSNQER